MHKTVAFVRHGFDFIQDDMNEVRELQIMELRRIFWHHS
jgi:hypothetical protein